MIFHLGRTLEVAERGERCWPGLVLQGDSYHNAGAHRISLWCMLVLLSPNVQLVLNTMMYNHFLFSPGNCSFTNAVSLQYRPQTNLLPSFLAPPRHSQAPSETTLSTELFCCQSILDRFFPVILLFLTFPLFRHQPQIQAWSRIILGCQNLRTSQRWEHSSKTSQS